MSPQLRKLLRINNDPQKGFTLVESLLVLAMFFILSTVTVFSLKPQQSTMEDERFLSQLKADLFFAQNYALSHQQEILIYILPSQHKYVMYRRPDQPPLVEQSYSTKYLLTEGSLPLSFKFLPNGNISKFGSLFIYTSEKMYHLTFLIGRGRFYVTED